MVMPDTGILVRKLSSSALKGKIVHRAGNAQAHLAGHGQVFR
jgi:hypothetical protein